jgi:protein-S-isoprenylcysteine O-methyltransferase Ste14
MNLHSRTEVKIFAAALAVRWLYAAGLYLAMGDGGLQGMDSQTYLAHSADFVATIRGGLIHGLQWLGPDPGIMPLFTWLTTVNALAFPDHAPLAYVLMQGIVDAATCVVIYGIACNVNTRYALAAAIAAVVNPTQIVLTGLVYNDTPFTFCAALFLYATVRYLRTQEWRHALLLGASLGAAAWIRIVGAPWVAVIVVFLAAVLALEKRLTLRRLVQLGAASVLAAVFVGVLLWRNVVIYDAWALTPQGGKHFAIWVVPLAKEALDGTPWVESREKMEARKLERFGREPPNPFEDSRQYLETAREAAAALPLAAYAKSWLMGAALNLGSPAVILSPPVSQLPRTGFYATQGSTLIAKVWSFLFRSDNPAYAWFLILGVAGVAAMRALQLIGFIAILFRRAEWAPLALFMLWAGYMLAANGPVGSPKYRLPLEPVLMVLAGAGWSTLRRRTGINA